MVRTSWSVTRMLRPTLGCHAAVKAWVALALLLGVVACTGATGKQGGDAGEDAMAPPDQRSGDVGEDQTATPGQRSGDDEEDQTSTSVPREELEERRVNERSPPPSPPSGDPCRDLQGEELEGSATVRLFFPCQAAETFVSGFTREIASEEPARTAFQELFEGPTPTEEAEGAKWPSGDIDYELTITDGQIVLDVESTTDYFLAFKVNGPLISAVERTGEQFGREFELMLDGVPWAEAVGEAGQ